MRQQHRGNANVIVDDLSLRETNFRIQHLIEIRYGELRLSDYDFSFLTHDALRLFFASASEFAGIEATVLRNLAEGH
jgi:hypothetical protein